TRSCRRSGRKSCRRNDRKSGPADSAGPPSPDAIEKFVSPVTSSANERLASRRSTLAGLDFSSPAVASIRLLFSAPPLILGGYSLMPLAGQGSFSLDNYRHFLGEPAYVQAIWNSVVTTAIVVVASLLLAYPFAYILAYKVPKRWQRLALACAILPFWTSYV